MEEKEINRPHSTQSQQSLPCLSVSLAVSLSPSLSLLSVDARQPLALSYRCGYHSRRAADASPTPQGRARERKESRFENRTFSWCWLLALCQQFFSCTWHCSSFRFYFWRCAKKMYWTLGTVPKVVFVSWRRANYRIWVLDSVPVSVLPLAECQEKFHPILGTIPKVDFDMGF